MMARTIRISTSAKPIDDYRQMSGTPTQNMHLFIPDPAAFPPLIDSNLAGCRRQRGLKAQNPKPTLQNPERRLPYAAPPHVATRSDTQDNRQFFREFKERLKSRFRQVDIWITTRLIESI